MKLSSMLIQSDPTYQDQRFNEFLETHLEFLLKNKSRLTFQVDPDVGDKYIGDFYGLLTHFRIPIDQHYITMRLNEFISPSDYTGNPIIIIRTSDEHLALLKNIWRTKDV